MKNILLCDANFCTLPIVESIKRKGYKLSVVGSLLSDPAHTIADDSINIDYSDVNLLYSHLSNHSYDGVVPGCNDRAYLSLAYIAEKLNFSGFDDYEKVLIIHHKDKFRAFAEKHNYPIPKAINKLKDIDKLRFPVLVKPIDLYSGKGINKAKNIDELNVYWREAEKLSFSGSVVAEEFVEGKLYSHSAFIKNKKIIIDFFVNEYCTVYPYQVNSSNVAGLLNKNIKEELRRWTEKFAIDLDLCDGLIHTQFISDNESFYLIEVARRCPGDLYSELIRKSTGINYAELYTMPFCGLELPEEIENITEKFISRHTVSLDKDSIFISSSIDIDHIAVENVQLKCIGEKLAAAPYGKSGIYFIEHKTKNAMESLTAKLKEYVTIKTLTF
jgi:glutathione synthase/RimK-type ligase-like ATP-grasp enzyme